MDQNIYLVAIAIVVVALDIVVRVFVYPKRRDRFYQALLEMQAGVRARRAKPQGPSPDDESLSQALLEYFQQSFTSRQILFMLATTAQGIGGRELERKVADRVAEQWNRELSINAIRRVIMILMGANLIELKGEKFALTNIGWTLFRITKSAEGPRWAEAAALSQVHAQ